MPLAEPQNRTSVLRQFWWEFDLHQTRPNRQSITMLGRFSPWHFLTPLYKQSKHLAKVLLPCGGVPRRIGISTRSGTATVSLERRLV